MLLSSQEYLLVNQVVWICYEVFSVNESPLGTMVPYQGFIDSHVFEAGPSTNTSYHHLSSNVDGSDSDSEAEPSTSEESEAIPSSIETIDVDADESEIEPRFNSTNVSQPPNIDLNYSNDHEELKAYATNDSDDNDDMKIWDENYPARVGLGRSFIDRQLFDEMPVSWVAFVLTLF
ncbi:hypothetical protein R6Q59_024532 [Mikania micrantha]